MKKYSGNNSIKNIMKVVYNWMKDKFLPTSGGTLSKNGYAILTLKRTGGGR